MPLATVGEEKVDSLPLLLSTVVRQCLHSGYTHYFRPGRRRLRWLKRGDDLLTTALLACHLPDPLVPDSLSFHLVQNSLVLSRSRAGINEANVRVVAKPSKWLRIGLEMGSRPVSLNVSAPAGIPSPWECELMK